MPNYFILVLIRLFFKQINLPFIQLHLPFAQIIQNKFYFYKTKKPAFIKQV